MIPFNRNSKIKDDFTVRCVGPGPDWKYFVTNGGKEFSIDVKPIYGYFDVDNKFVRTRKPL